MSIVIAERSIDVNRGDQLGVIFRIISGEYVVHNYYKEYNKEAKEYLPCDYHSGYYAKTEKEGQKVYKKRRKQLMDADTRRRAGY
jgi:hypothetical protein